MENDNLLSEIVCSSGAPAQISNSHEVIEREITYSDSFGHTSLKKIHFSGVRLLYGKLKFIRPVPIKMLNDSPYIEMYFSLAGSRDILFPLSAKRSSVAAGHHNIYYIPDEEFYIEPSVGEEENITLQIQFTEDYFKRFMPVGHPLFSTFIKEIDEHRLSILSTSDLGITPEMYTLLNDIVSCGREGGIKQLFIETCALKLLLLQFEQYESSASKPGYKHIKEYDIEKIRMVKQLLEDNISYHHSLVELARKAGLNDFKLKKGFKELYGNTVFGYLHELRMAKAKELLHGEMKTISEIAEHCGYGYVQSFSTAFKQMHGITPEKYRKKERLPQ